MTMGEQMPEANRLNNYYDDYEEYLLRKDREAIEQLRIMALAREGKRQGQISLRAQESRDRSVNN